MLYGAGLLFILALGGVWYFVIRTPGPCDVSREKIAVTDEAMRPWMKQNDTLSVEKNYYACNTIQRGDWVAYSLSGNLKPMVRIAVGIPGDDYELVESIEDGRWNLKINGEWYQTDWGSGLRKYFFGTSKVRPNLLSHDPKSPLTGKVNPGEVLLLANVPPGFMDAGVTGKRLIRETYGRVIQPDAFKKSTTTEGESQP